MKRLCSFLETHFRAGTRAWFWLVLLAAMLLAGSPVAKASTYVRGDRLWTNGVVAYKWDSALPIANRFRVFAAMNIWTNVAKVRFVLQTNEIDYVLIQNAASSNGSSSGSIGHNGGVQNLYIRTNLSNITDHGLAHEVGHVLGFYHSHQRPDRDNYITWYSNRTEPDKLGNFTIEPDALGYPRNSMDFDSVMSYPRCIFTTCTGCGQFCEDCPDTLESCRVLKIINPVALAEFDLLMGQRDYLTRNDELVMSFMYPQPNWRFVESGYGEGTERGTFHEPYFTAHKALTNVPNNTVLWVQPGSYRTGMNVISKPLTLRGPIGGVVIRRN